MIEVDVRLKVGAFSLDVAFDNGSGITALFGQSGSGKSLTLGIIAGLMKPDEGFVRLEGEALVDVGRKIFSLRCRADASVSSSRIPPFSASQA
ncbi:MAG: ATP-binding cassette domain-containing protein [Methylocystis sp.]